MLKKVFFIIAALFVFGLAIYWGVEYTSTPQYCVKCHEIEQAYETWKVSKHFQVANCRQCHISSWKNPISVLWEKTYHGLKDIYHHIKDKEELGYPGYLDQMKVNGRKNFPVSTCIKCHESIFESKDKRIASFHKGIYQLNKQKNTNIRCVDCHKNLVH